MCCFSGPVSRVSDTRIFARLDGARQLLAYQLTLSAAEQVAMVLPLPVPPGSAEDAVRFVDLSSDPWLFSMLRDQFEQTGDGTEGAELAAAPGAAAEPLVVQQVGAFEASFVPSPEDFGRLDTRFRLSDQVLGKLPMYRDWGFVVFKLRPGAGDTRFHPMAFSFPSRSPGQAFFPTVHVHDGEVHADAHFDHQLYAQLGPGLVAADAGWRRSSGVLGDPAVPRLIDPAQLGFYTRVAGTHPNRDVWLSAQPESAGDAALRVRSAAQLFEAKQQHQAWQAQAAREELKERILRAVIGLPVALGLGFLVFISTQPAATVIFAVVWLLAVWLTAQAVTNRARWATGAALLAGLAAAASRWLA